MTGTRQRIMQPGRPHDPNCVGREAGTDLSVRFVLMMHHRSAVTVVTVVEAVVRPVVDPGEEPGVERGEA